MEKEKMMEGCVMSERETRTRKPSNLYPQLEPPTIPAPTAIKYNQGKLRVHLCPPFLRNMMISALEYGCKKYFENSWRKGFLVSDMYSAANRHMDAFFHDREDIDEESQCHHLDCAIFSIAMMRYSVDLEGMDNRPPVTPEQIAEVIRLGMIEVEKRKQLEYLKGVV